MEQLKSLGYTFLAGFAVEIYPLLNDVSVETLTKATLLGLLFAGIRAGIKALIEYSFITKKS